MENDRRIQIIRTAAKRFARHGLNKTTLEEIARDLRIGKATIYHYFESKETLFFQTLENDALLFIEDIKQIFNNEEISVKERFIEYFNYKQEIYNKYKLLYDLIIRILKEESIEMEQQIFRTLLQNEAAVLKLVLNSLYSTRIESMNPELPDFFSLHSWGILFGKKLNDLRNNELPAISNDLVLASLDKILAEK